MSDLMEEIIEASENEYESFEESNLIQYNLAELGLEEYESNTLVQKNVHELKLFFENRSNCRCRNENENENEICFEKIGLKIFLKDTWN